MGIFGGCGCYAVFALEWSGFPPETPPCPVACCGLTAVFTVPCFLRPLHGVTCYGYEFSAAHQCWSFAPACGPVRSSHVSTEFLSLLHFPFANVIRPPFPVVILFDSVQCWSIAPTCAGLLAFVSVMFPCEASIHLREGGSSFISHSRGVAAFGLFSTVSVACNT